MMHVVIIITMKWSFMTHGSFNGIIELMMA